MMDQKISTTFKVKHEDREYSLTFPGDARLQELWDFLQEIANKVIETNKQNAAAAQESQASTDAPSTEPAVQPQGE
jgi:hypothetical protein